MQISRHWRMNSQRYRLEGVRYNSGDVSIEDRPIPVEDMSTLEVIEAVPVVATNNKTEVAA